MEAGQKTQHQRVTLSYSVESEGSWNPFLGGRGDGFLRRLRVFRRVFHGFFLHTESLVLGVLALRAWDWKGPQLGLGSRNKDGYATIYPTHAEFKAFNDSRSAQSSRLTLTAG